jgi:hypothetical protein
MELSKEKAQKANHAADAIGDVMAKTLVNMRSGFVRRYDLDDQLITLAIAKAAVVIAADAASQATGMVAEECDELEDRLHAVVLDAIDEFTR